MSLRDPLSPCVKLCNYNPFRGECEGCHRTLEEIGGWSGYSAERKREILAEVKKRRDVAEAAARDA